ncbi:MAG: class I SAM-dependent methyltransferase [Actinomycetota bacterium]
MTARTVRVSPGWLTLREPADAAARAVEVVQQIQPYLPAGGPALIHDLGCGTGSMGRWLAPRLSGTQHWVMYDRDADLLAQAASNPPGAAADGAAVTIQTRQRDITRLDSREMAGASLITASALLDMMTADEIERLVGSCMDAGCPALVTISVIGRVDLIPADPLDAQIASAFNAHQRRTTGGRRLLGPDAVSAAADAFTRLGADVLVLPSPWLLGADQGALAAEWLTGWIGAACAHRPELTAAAADYARRRLPLANAGQLSIRVHHQDLLVRPR